jgi:NAD(P)-dependent dehydrogenase (short-subunit alcohol dehydrogenase family)
MTTTSQCLVTVAAYTKGPPPMTENFPGPMAGKTALVTGGTGGTGGIGRATAAGLAALGARVGITGRARQARAARLAPGRAERYRLATSWLPVAPGWLSWRACHGGSTYEIAHGAHSGGQQLAARTWADPGGG